MTPAGFWMNFKDDLIVTKNSDQGPWGGYREIYWESKKEKTFNATELIDFASRNGWHVTDSLTYKKSYLKSLTNYDNDYSFAILNEKVLARITSADIRIFVFNTGWIAVEPGNFRDTDKNGFVVINSPGTDLRIFHVWGE